MSGLIKYPEERAIEDAAFSMGLIPTRLCRVLLPTWRAEVAATIYDSEPYDLIDRYLEAAIARGGLGSAEEIAEFYGLDLAVTGSAVRFLESIRHLTLDGGGRLALTDIGLQSVRDGRRYTQELSGPKVCSTWRPLLCGAHHDARLISGSGGRVNAGVPGR